jgi:hypothetical protein
LSQDKSTNECVDVLLNEIAAGGGSDAGGAEYFDGKASIHSESKLSHIQKYKDLSNQDNTF